ncbi:MAG: long-chain fatty acid--CoA ligase [Deltaproteobacteria bacterium]|nr:long-chain fatty acid--CoA ligase [Deltaproteobacteria bacterium]TLN01165.1 MAG: long-chain fatty acid--CoA ligase [bacterium]
MFRGLLGSFDKDRVLIVSNDEQVTCGNLMSVISAYDESQYYGRHIALLMKNQINTAAAMLMLEGVAGNVLLLPSDVDEDNLSMLLGRYDADLILTDQSPPACLKNKSESIRDFSISSGIPDVPHGDIGYQQAKTVTRWIIPTSGTTGTPKLISHTLETLSRTAKKSISASRFYRWGLLYDISRFAGLQVFLNSILSGSVLILSDLFASFENRLDVLVRHGCNALSATPTMWRKLMMLPAFRKLELGQVTLGGEIADQSVLSALRAMYPTARIVHIYASTEAGVGFSVTDGCAGFPKTMLVNPPEGITLKVDEIGFLLLRPALRDQEYAGNAVPLFGDDGFINTGDLVVEEGERYYFLGRANGAINVGGNKVQPEEIENLIYTFSNVKLVSVYGKKNPITGYVVAADVVLDSLSGDAAEFKRKLAAYCAEKLPPYKRPVLIKIVSDLDINRAGKVVRS